MTHRQQHNRRSSNWMLTAAVAAVPLLGLAMPASAQYQTGNDGRARDANNRVGSGGRNDGGGRVGTSVTANQIANGNVTRGQGFRGPLQSTDARAFRGNTAGGVSDRFIADSSGVPARGATFASNFSAQPFYGESRAVAPPPGYQQIGSTGGYVAQQPGTYPNGYNNRYIGLGETYGSLNTGEGLTPRQAGTSIVPGPTDPNNPNRSSTLLLSPLAGIRQLTPEDLSEYLAARDNPNAVPGRDPAAASGARFDPAQIQQMRDELLSSGADIDGPGSPANPNRANGAGSINRPSPLDASTTPPPTGQAQPLDRPLGKPLEAPGDQAINRNQLGTPIEATPIGGSTDTDQSVRRQLAVPAPAQQSAQYRELQRRMKRYNEDMEMTDQEAQRQFRQQQTALEAVRNGGAARPGTPGTAGTGNPVPATPGATPPGTATPGGGARPGPVTPGTGGGPANTVPRTGRDPIVPRTPALPGVGAPDAPKSDAAAPAAVRPIEPMRITSLATGVTGQGLTTVLKTAEDQMKQGKFSSAIEQYDLAQQVAPNNPMIKLGKSIAELGASSYRSAETDLRQAIAADEALLMAQYDLRGFVGPQRLQILVNDLKEIAKAEPKETMAPFLLAYISYNTGAEGAALPLLDVVDQRAGGPDPIVQAMRKYWSPKAQSVPAVPTTREATPEANK